MSQGIEKTNKLILLVEMDKVRYYFYLHVSRNNERDRTIKNYAFKLFFILDETRINIFVILKMNKLKKWDFLLFWIWNLEFGIFML